MCCECACACVCCVVLEHSEVTTQEPQNVEQVSLPLKLTYQYPDPSDKGTDDFGCLFLGLSVLFGHQKSCFLVCQCLFGHQKAYTVSLPVCGVCFFCLFFVCLVFVAVLLLLLFCFVETEKLLVIQGICHINFVLNVILPTTGRGG